MAIQSFARKEVESFFLEGRVHKGTGWSNAAGVVKRKLDMVHYANTLSDLASPPGNRLEPLKGDLKGLHSIRVNDQWRIVFRFDESGARDVDVLDYH